VRQAEPEAMVGGEVGAEGSVGVAAERMAGVVATVAAVMAQVAALEVD